MTYSKEVWTEKRKAGLARYLMIDGILYTGGPFAVVMQVIGIFFLRDEGQTIGEYFTSPRTWGTFLLHGILFGLVVGYIKWRRAENAYAASAKSS